MKLVKYTDGTFAIVDITPADLVDLENCLYAGNHEGMSSEKTEQLRTDIEKEK